MSYIQKAFNNLYFCCSRYIHGTIYMQKIPKLCFFFYFFIMSDFDFLKLCNNRQKDERPFNYVYTFRSKNCSFF